LFVADSHLNSGIIDKLPKEKFAVSVFARMVPPFAAVLSADNWYLSLDKKNLT
jgi:hypothetical protein